MAKARLHISAAGQMGKKCKGHMHAVSLAFCEIFSHLKHFVYSSRSTWGVDPWQDCLPLFLGELHCDLYQDQSQQSCCSNDGLSTSNQAPQPSPCGLVSAGNSIQTQTKQQQDALGSLFLDGLTAPEADLDHFILELDDWSADLPNLDEFPESFSEQSLGNPTLSFDSSISSQVGFNLHPQEACPDAQSLLSQEQAAQPFPMSDHGANGSEQQSASPQESSAGLHPAAKKRKTWKSPSKLCGIGKRPRGRPRLYDTSLPEPGTSGEQESGAESENKQRDALKKKRGAKPKYTFSTEAEAVAMRRERNRNTAISSYYKKKERNEQLLHQIEELEHEQEALRQLDDIVQRRAVNAGMGYTKRVR